MRAAVLHTPRSPSGPEVVTVQDVATPTPGPGQVLIDVATCGLCASDLHVVQGITPTSHLPMVLGHEVAGTIAGLGSGVDGWAVGDRVLVLAMATCGRCGWCVGGQENRCASAEVLSVTVDGGMAEAIVVGAAQLVGLPDEVAFAHASILADAVATPWHAIRRSGLVAGQVAVVVGLGGLGQHAVLLARMLGARVVGVDTDPVARDRALARGASDVVDPADPDLLGRLRVLTDGGADVALEFVGRQATAKLAVACLRPGGRATLVGISRDRLTGPPLGLFVAEEREVVGAFGQTRAEVEELLDLVAGGRLDLTASVSHELPLAELPEALRMLETRQGSPARIVIHPARTADDQESA